jgi:hypothetical protein
MVDRGKQDVFPGGPMDGFTPFRNMTGVDRGALDAALTAAHFYIPEHLPSNVHLTPPARSSAAFCWAHSSHRRFAQKSVKELWLGCSTTCREFEDPRRLRISYSKR